MPLRDRLVRRIVADKRRTHPELRATVTLAGGLAVCDRERIIVMRRPDRRLGCAMVFLRRCGIILDSGLSDPDALPVLLHELGHVWLHLFDDALTEQRAAEIHQLGWGPLAERCEREADLVATLLLRPGAGTPSAARRHAVTGCYSYRNSR